VSAISNAEREAKAADVHSRAMAAKEFLIGQILEEAEREGVKLSNVEVQMLHFNPSWGGRQAIPEVARTFENEYSPAEYERKVVALVVASLKRARKENAALERRIRQAGAELKHGDYYLSPMVAAAVKKVRPRGDLVLLIVAAIGVTGVIAALAAFERYLDARGMVPHAGKVAWRMLGIAIYVTEIALAAALLLLGLRARFVARKARDSRLSQRG
jgi:hypothetical protein